MLVKGYIQPPPVFTIIYLFIFNECHPHWFSVMMEKRMQHFLLLFPFTLLNLKITNGQADNHSKENTEDSNGFYVLGHQSLPYLVCSLISGWVLPLPLSGSPSVLNTWKCFRTPVWFSLTRDGTLTP